MSQTAAPLDKLVREHFDDLSRTLRRTANWVLQNSTQVATRPLQELTELSGCSNTSFIRLAQELGFKGWRALRNHCAQMLRDGHGQIMFAERLVTQKFPATSAATRHAMLRTEVHNLQGCFTPTNADVIEETANRLANARTIALIGRRSCTPVITWLHYLLRMTFPNVVLADDRGGAFGLDLLPIGESDVVIAASFVPCSQETVAAARRLKKAGAWIVGIVDVSLNPLARTSDRHIVVQKESDAFFDSMVGAMMMAQWLVSAAVAVRGPKALELAKAHQRMMLETGAFSAEE